jgi:hypothetical protein
MPRQGTELQMQSAVEVVSLLRLDARVSIVWCSMPRRVGAVHGCMRATRSQLDGQLIRLNSRVFFCVLLLLLPSVVRCLYA